MNKFEGNCIAAIIYLLLIAGAIYFGLNFHPF